MAKGQRCSSLECLDSNVAAHFAHDRQREQFAHQELLIVRKLRYNNLKKIVGFTRYQMAGDDLRHLHHSLLKQERKLVRVPIDFDADKH